MFGFQKRRVLMPREDLYVYSTYSDINHIGFKNPYLEWIKLREKCNLEFLWWHDLRRTWATMAAMTASRSPRQRCPHRSVAGVAASWPSPFCCSPSPRWSPTTPMASPTSSTSPARRTPRPSSWSTASPCSAWSCSVLSPA